MTFQMEQKWFDLPLAMCIFIAVSVHKQFTKKGERRIAVGLIGLKCISGEHLRVLVPAVSVRLKVAARKILWV